NVGIQWGIFFALAAAGLLAVAGSRMRASARPEAEAAPPAVFADEEVTVARPPRLKRSAPTPARDRPRYPTTPGESIAHRGQPPRRDSGQRGDAEQLSFEDHATEPEPDVVSDPAPRSAPDTDQR
ncbi:MAG TPA: hypothetical protein VII53_03095, partial [Solirubrobacteraceae bacterium]